MPGRNLSAFYSLFGPETVFLPVAYGSKRCLTRSWQAITFEATQTHDYQFELQGGNLAVSVGPASHDLISIDLDLKELGMLLVGLNPWLAQTLCTQGSKGCNLWLRMQGDYPKVIRRFDPRKPLGEWRGGGGYTIVDGRHPAGCDYRILVPNPPILIPYADIKWPDIFDRPEAAEPETQQLIYPTWMNDTRVPADDRIKPEVLIDGLLHRGNKMILSGGSKTYKTWTLIDLAVSLAFGAHWLGFKCHPSKVLYINFEVQMPFFMERLDAIKKTKKLPQNDNLFIWTLRGYDGDIQKVTAELISRLAQSGERFDVIIWDPIYKTYGILRENDASEMSILMNHLDALTRQIGVSNVLGHHFSKGNQAGKEAIDRMSGSGVYGRDPDSILTITQHEQKHAFIIELILRNNPEVTSFVVSWDYPLLVRDIALSPSDVKQKSSSKPPLCTPAQLLALVRKFDNQFQSKDWVKLTGEEFGISRSLLYEIKAFLEAQKLIYVSPVNKCWCICP